MNPEEPTPCVASTVKDGRMKIFSASCAKEKDEHMINSVIELTESAKKHSERVKKCFIVLFNSPAPESFSSNCTLSCRH